jgi:ribosomal-protein-alanine N-acetyltransferase
MIASSAAGFAGSGHGLYIVERDGSPIGICGFQSSGTPPERQIVYALDPGHWHQGYAREAVAAVVAAARARGAPTILATAAADNRASIAVLLACGFMAHYELIERGRAVIRFVL